MKKILFFITSLTFISLVSAQTVKNQSTAVAEKTKSEAKPVKEIMQGLLNVTSKIYPYIFSESKFTDKANESQIKPLLADFKQKAQELKTSQFAQSDDMKFRSAQLFDIVSEAESSFSGGFKNYSYWALRSSYNNCYSCHTDKSLPATAIKADVMKGASDFENAEYLFLVRNYSEAIPLYIKLIKNYPRNKVSEAQLQEITKKVFYYYVRIEQDDNKAIKMLDEVLISRRLPENIRKQLYTWNKFLEAKKAHPVVITKVESEQDIKNLIASYENLAKGLDQNHVQYVLSLETSHALFKQLESNKNKDLKPWLLYYSADLAKYNRTSMFDLTTELYLAECLEVYAGSDAAPKCLELYKDIKVKSQGSGGHVPKETFDQIKIYEDSISKAQKNKSKSK